MAGIIGLSHITLATANIDRAFGFYTDILGARPRARWTTGAYLELGTIWLCLAQGTVRQHKDYSHLSIACAEEDFAPLAARISEAASLWQENKSEGASLYFLDPDGHRLELHVGGLEARLADIRSRPDTSVTLLD
jgi:catechol 2,3-dioxygenase-like lactoylglutathione lyase family enzyme